MDAYLSTIMNSFYGAAGQRCLANSLVLPIGEARDAARERVAEAGRNPPSMTAQADSPGAITDVPGFLVGHVTHLEPITGCTVIVCPTGTVGGVELRGGWTGTREMDILSPLSTSPSVHALLFTGGSDYGLAAADGVMRWVEERIARNVTGLYPVPQVPAAVIYDLAVGDPRGRPTADDGYTACEAASETFERGSVGCGTGATIGPVIPGMSRMKGGLGSASRRFGAAGVVGALAVTNSLGNIVDRDGKIIAGTHDRDGHPRDAVSYLQEHPEVAASSSLTSNTTLVVVATNAALSKTECGKVARMAQAGLARAVHPAFTAYDGDTVVVLANGGHVASVDTIGIISAEVVADALRDSVRRATSLGGVPDMRTPGARNPDDPAWSAT
jgi:L-aminopeptidase/D-esterase-like protein